MDAEKQAVYSILHLYCSPYTVSSALEGDS